MNKPLFIFVETDSAVIKHELPQDFDGNMGNFIARLVSENSYPSNIVVYVGGFA